MKCRVKLFWGGKKQRVGLDHDRPPKRTKDDEKSMRSVGAAINWHPNSLCTSGHEQSTTTDNSRLHPQLKEGRAHASGWVELSPTTELELLDCSALGSGIWSAVAPATGSLTITTHSLTRSLYQCSVVQCGAEWLFRSVVGSIVC